MPPLALILAAILSLIDYMTENVVKKKFFVNQKMISFSSGVAIAYIFLHLIPELSVLSIIGGKVLFLYALIGFVFISLIERYLYLHHRGHAKGVHQGVHLTYFFIYNALVGITLVHFSDRGLIDALLFFIPFLLYISIEILPRKFHFRSMLSRVLYASAPLFGVVLALAFPYFFNQVYAEIIAIVCGTLLFIVIRESMPSERDAMPLFFLFGALLYGGLLFLLQLL